MFGDFDLNSLMQQAQKLQDDFSRAQEEVGSKTFVGKAGGELVTAMVSGKGDLEGLVISPEACDPEDTETLADLIVAAFRSAKGQADEAMAAAMPQLPGMPPMGGGMPGMPGLGG